MDDTQEKENASREKLMIVLAFTLILSSMSATMFNIVLPAISAEFRLSLSQVSWMTAIYALIYAIGSVMYGKLADVYKLKNLLTFGLGLFFVGSLVGLAAQAFWMALLGRLLQAAGASAIPAAAMIIPVRYFPPERRGRALGVSATGLAIGGALGPVVSALVAGSLNWRWLFCVPLLVLATLPFYRKYLDDRKGAGGRLDWLGGLLLAVAVALLLLAVTRGSWALAGGSLISFLLFLVRIRKAAEPFVQTRLFRDPKYSTGLALAMLIMGAGYSLPFLTPQLLSDVHHLAPGWIGVAMVPAAAVSALLGRSAGKFADKKGNVLLFVLSSALLLACFALMSTWAGYSPYFVAGVLVLGNAGQMFMQLALNNTISRTLAKDQTGVGMGMVSLIGFLSSAVATSVYGKIVDAGSTASWNPLNSYRGSFAFGNIYFALLLLHLAIGAIYLLRFGSVRRASLERGAASPKA